MSLGVHDELCVRGSGLGRGDGLADGPRGPGLASLPVRSGKPARTIEDICREDIGDDRKIVNAVAVQVADRHERIGVVVARGRYRLLGRRRVD